MWRQPRARDRLILSGSIDLSGKPHRNCWFAWLFNALNLVEAPSESEIEFPVTVEALTDDSRTAVSFNLPIRIFHSIEEMNLPSETSRLSLPPVDFPEVHIKPVDSTPSGEHLSVPQLLSYIHCPTKFYLKHRLGLPDTNVLLSQESNSDSRDFTIRRALAHLRTATNSERDLSKLIKSATESVSDDLAEDDVALHVKHVPGFRTGEPDVSRR